MKSGVDWADRERRELYIRDQPLSQMIQEMDFTDAIFHTWLQKKPSEKEKIMFNKVLVSFCGGWNIIAPVVFATRLAATTKAPIAQCLAAGFCASGPSHTSAIEGIMKIYLEVETGKIDEFVHEKLSKKEILPGFGHPVVWKDPRPPIVYQECKKLGVGGDALRKFEKIEAILSRKKGVYANIDAINGAILVDLGFDDPAYGPALFLLGRSIGMTAHVIEEMKNPPFTALDLVYPGFEKIEYEHKEKVREHQGDKK